MSKENTHRRIPRQAGEITHYDLNELSRKMSEQIFAIEGRRGPIKQKDTLEIQASERRTPLRFRGTGNRGSGSISFGGLDNASMFTAKGAYQNDNGAWIAEDTTAVIMEMNRNSETPIMYRNTGLQIGQVFTPISVGGVVTGSSPGGGGGVTPIPAMQLDDLTDVNVSAVADGQVLTYNAATDTWIAVTPGAATGVAFRHEFMMMGS